MQAFRSVPCMHVLCMCLYKAIHSWHAEAYDPIRSKVTAHRATPAGALPAGWIQEPRAVKCNRPGKLSLQLQLLALPIWCWR